MPKASPGSTPTSSRSGRTMPTSPSNSPKKAFRKSSSTTSVFRKTDPSSTENGSVVDRLVRYANPDGRSKAEGIADYIATVRERLRPYPVFLSADVFGLVTTVADDMNIGQKWELISPRVDVISPMMYPSHYAPGSYGVPKPDLAPAAIIAAGLQDAARKDAAVRAAGYRPAAIRPWYQAFSAPWLGTGNWMPYGPAEVKSQITAGEAAGIRSYLLWDPANRYEAAYFR
ncbi:putative glycoside hydrolase [Hydrogenibacillus schlegelii]